jgi:diguanylate cyclase (GGDEF)-like protein
LTVHIPTLLLALVMGFALLGLTLALAQRGTVRDPALQRWNQGVWAFLAGFGLFALRPWLPLWLSIVGGNAMLALGGTLLAAALYRFLLDRALPRWIWGLCGLAVLSVIAMATWPLAPRTSVISFVFAALLLPSVGLIVRHGWHAEHSLRTVAATLGLALLALLARGTHALLAPDEYQTLLQPSVGQGLTFLTAFVSLLGAGFGFVLCCLERAAQRMELLATHDALTGCLNRGSTDTLLEHTLQRGRREGAPVAVLLLDIDHFKQVNDRFGHRTGDAVLKAFAQTVRARLRHSDVLGRVGGEEFLVLLPATDTAGAVRVSENVRAAVAGMQVDGGDSTPVRVTVSGGVAVAASDSQLSADRLYGLADQALYRAKAEGRNRIVPADTTAAAVADAAA